MYDHLTLSRLERGGEAISAHSGIPLAGTIPHSYGGKPYKSPVTRLGTESRDDATFISYPSVLCQIFGSKRISHSEEGRA